MNDRTLSMVTFSHANRHVSNDTNKRKPVKKRSLREKNYVASKEM